MILISAEKLHFVFYLTIGLLSLSLLTECDKIRLVGPSRCAGRVEVFHMNSWGTVCDDQWTLANAEVVCRELDCGAVLEAKKMAFFGEGKDQIWLDDVQCTGQETSIVKCLHRPFGVNNCGHGEDAGVICLEHVRVVNGSNHCNGRVEIFHDGVWKRGCSSDWNREEAQVVCREVNCGTPATQAEVSYFGEAHGMAAVKASCTGNETSVSQCTLQDFRESCVDATVFCTNSKPIRLMNGTHRCSGRVEVYHSGQWGSVCDDRWGMQEAAVTCRDMNCGTPLAVKYKAFFGRSDGPVLLDDLECQGHEKSLSNCPNRGFGEHDCNHDEDAGVVCSESLRLVNGTDRCSGRVEVFHNGQWGKLCRNNWGPQQAAVVCREINCGSPRKNQETFNFGESALTGYTSTCSDSVSSISQCAFQENTGRCEAVSLSCAGNPPLRLVNGTNQCSGRVEVLHDDQWGTVCDDEWDIRDAQVVCRAMDCGTAQAAKAGAFFGQGQGGIWLDDVRCIGNETSLMHCRHPTLGENNCGHGEDAGVVCSATIRLLNGTDQCSGRVELNNGGRWAPVHNINWGMGEAEVVCREMNCGDPVKVSGSFGRGTELTGYLVSCNGRESSLTQCRLTEHARTIQDNLEEAGVQCSGTVKLAGGNTHCDGRVEFYDKGHWGSVCGESWDMNDAMVVCRQLDCGRAHKITTVADQSPGQIWLDQIGCNGLEASLSECPQRPYIDRTCNATSIAGVTCSGSLEVRLANGRDECSGRVEVRHSETWQTVCDTDWNLSKAEVVCEQLECGRAVDAPSGPRFGQGVGPVVAASDSCFGNVTNLRQCSVRGFTSSTCGHEHDAGVLCAAQLRLVDGAGECSGRVEVFYKSQWGTVCDDEWDMRDADVVCKQLGCGHAVSAPSSAHFGRGSGPIWLDNVECSGQEFALTHCMHAGMGHNNCGHGEDAGVICLGALQKPQIHLNPSSEINWGEKLEITCSLVTEHLGGTFVLKKTEGSFKMEKYSDSEIATFLFPKVEFSQRGSYFCEYQKKLPNQVIYYPQGNTAELSVIVRLDKPSISLTSPHAMLVYSPDKISVNQGGSFSVMCSTYSRYSGGFFYLTKSNTNTTEMKPALDHTFFHQATFEFAAIDFEHQGDYHCVYAVNISALSFCSVASKSLQVTVIGNSSSSVAGGVVGGLVALILLLGVGYLVWRKREQGAATMVQFFNRFGGTVKQDVEDRSNIAYDGRDLNAQVKEQEQSQVPEEKNAAAAAADTSVEKGPEDLPGRVCYELDPLVLP